MTGMSSLFCLICDITVNDSTCVNVYTTSQGNGESLADFVTRIFRPSALEFHSTYICLQCYKLFQMLEQAQHTVANIRGEILKVYRRSNKERAINQTQSKKHDFVENFGEQNKAIIDDRANQAKPIFSLRPVDNEFITTQTFSEDTMLNPNLNILNIDTVIDINTAKVIRNTNTKRKEVNYLIKNATCHAPMIDTKSVNCNSDIINSDITVIEEHPKSSDFNIENLNDTLNNLTALKNDHNVNDGKNGEQMSLSYIYQHKDCIELLKSPNEFHVHTLKHVNSQNYSNSEDKLEFSNISEADVINTCKDTVTKTNIKEPSPPQSNQTQEQNLLQTYESVINVVEIRSDIESSSEKEVKDCCTAANANVQTEANCAAISRTSKQTSKYSLKPTEHSCPTCGMKLKTSTELKAHTNTHATLSKNTRPYMCEKCGRSYKHKHALEVHIGMHNGINPFQCSYCKKCFTQKGALVRHLPMHTGETPYQCELCGKRFVHHTSYNMHMLSHTGKKSHQCEVCNKSLFSTSHLKRHMRVHTGEKPYSCNLCGKRFAERYNLFAHHKIHDISGVSAKERRKIKKKCEQLDERQGSNIQSGSCVDTFSVSENTAEMSDSFAAHIQIHDVTTEEPSRQSSASEQMWIQSGSAQLQGIGVNQMSSLSQLNARRLATYTDSNFVAQSTDRDARRQVDVSADADFNSNHIANDKAHL